MLGRFLEYSASAQPLAASFEFYRALGFVDIPVGDTLPDPYLVMFDGAIAIGLHDREEPATLEEFFDVFLERDKTVIMTNAENAHSPGSQFPKYIDVDTALELFPSGI